jgi:oligopeptidase B
LFYSTLDDTLRPYRLYRHVIGTSPAEDHLMYEEEDPAFRLTVTKSRSGRYIFLRSQSQITTEVRVLAADASDGEFRLVEPRCEGMEYYLLHRGDRFYILTNDNATNFKIISAPVSSPGRDNWSDVVAHDAETLIEDAEMFANHLVLYERYEGLNAVRVIDLRTGEDHYVDFDEALFVCWSGKNPQFNTNIIRLIYSSLVTPETVLAYDMDRRERTVLKVEQVAGGYDKSAYRSERVHAVAKDGTEVPISLVYRRGLERDGSNPLLLYGYGAYGTSVEPEFWSGRLSLLDRGFIYAIAHVRGGSELGREWYEDGKMLAKMNTFTDFIACAEHLIKQGYTSSDKLVIEGMSAGGLLIGVVVNMRPDLFQAAIADVPFVDVVNTMMDDSIPRTVTEYDEWGNPLEDKEIRDYLRSYSPYENVTARTYPSMLVTAGMGDHRVHYWEPAKWVARLRALKTDDNLLLLRTDFRSGHFGPSGRFDYLREFAFELAFIFDVLGIEPPNQPGD